MKRSPRNPSWSEWLRALPGLLPTLIALRYDRLADDLADAFARAARHPRRAGVSTVRVDPPTPPKGGPH